MDKSLEHLATLGLGPDASWDDVNQAYKDMMRVWHPDRFQSDDRLRKKAEEQSQRINHAMAELRKLGKHGLNKATQNKTKPSTQQTKTAKRPSPQQARRQPEQRNTHHQQAQTGHTGHHQNSDFTQASFSFVLAPLLVRAKTGTALFRALASLAVLYLAYDSLLRSLANPQQEAFTVAVIFAALDFGMRNILTIIVPGPIVAVHKTGLFLHRIGKLNWIDFESVSPLVTPRFSTLSVTFSPRYIQKQDQLTRAILYAKKWFNPAHLVVPFNGLTASPTDVVNAMRLFQLHQQMVVEDIKPQNSKALLILQAVAIAACAIPIIRCLSEGGLSNTEYSVYIAVFVVCRLADFILRRARIRF
jgi:hypothetical protein